MLEEGIEMLREEKLEEIGKVAHYFTKIEVAVIDLTPAREAPTVA